MPLLPRTREAATTKMRPPKLFYHRLHGQEHCFVRRLEGNESFSYHVEAGYS